VLSRINLILLEITYANPVPVNLDELISSEYIRELCLEKFLEIMHFSDKSAEDVLSSSFSNSPIYRVTDR
jgi:hypothetical protein